MTDDTFPLRPVTAGDRLRFVCLWTFVAALALAAGLGPDWPPPARSLELFLIGWVFPAGVVGAVVLVLGVVAWLAPDRRVLVLGDSEATLPRGRLMPGTLRVPFDSVRSIAWAPVWPFLTRRLVVEDRRRRTVVHHASWLERASDLEELARLLEARVEEADPSGTRIAAIRARARVGDAASGVTPWVTGGVLGVVVVALAAQSLAGAFESPYLLWEGAAASWLVGAGEWHRVPTSSVLHGGWVHVVANLIVIAMVGPLVEGLIGGWRTVVVYAVGALAGTTAMVVVAPDRAGVGASGAWFGLVGVLLALSLLDRERLPPPYGVRPLMMAMIAVILVVMDVGMPQVATATHLGGLAGGALVALVFRPGLDLTARDKRAPVWIKSLAVGLVALFAVSLVASVRAAFDSSPSELARRTALHFAERDEAAGWAEREERRARDYAFEAWAHRLANLPDARRADLEAVRPFALARAELEGGIPALVAASVEHALGEPERALALQEQSTRGSRDPERLRVLAAHRLRALRAGRLDPAAFGARLEARADGGLVVVVKEPPAEGFLVDAIVVEGDALAGVVRLTAGAGVGQRVESTDTYLSPEAVEDGARLVVVDVRPLEPDDHPHVGPGQAGWLHQSIDPDVPVLREPLPAS